MYLAKDIFTEFYVCCAATRPVAIAHFKRWIEEKMGFKEKWISLGMELHLNKTHSEPWKVFFLKLGEEVVDKFNYRTIRNLTLVTKPLLMSG